MLNSRHELHSGGMELLAAGHKGRGQLAVAVPALQGAVCIQYLRQEFIPRSLPVAGLIIAIGIIEMNAGAHNH